MSLLEQLALPQVWQSFITYKTSLVCPQRERDEWQRFVDGGEYAPVAEGILSGAAFPLAEKAVIAKADTAKKRVVYKYPRRETAVLKLLTYLLLRKYDGVFADNLYSFRPGRTAQDAVRCLLKTPDLFDKYAYKVDVHDYFNSIDIARFLPLLECTLADDRPLFEFLASLLTEERVRERGRVVTERKGIMAGTPQSAFYANLFLSDLDHLFADRGVTYVRYSDDIIVFAESEEQTREYAREIRAHLAAKGLTVNPDKEAFFTPDTGFTFLGFFCRGGVVDIAPFSVQKIKRKMKRKTRALERWCDRGGIDRGKAVTAFIRVFNAKLLDAPTDNDLSWSNWFFSVINTADSLREIDAYAQNCLRRLATGTNTKARFNFTYEDMKQAGYRSLVHEYYARRPEQAE